MSEHPFTYECPSCNHLNESFHELPQRCSACDFMIYDEDIPLLEEDLDYVHPFAWSNTMMDLYEGELYVDQ